MNTMSPAEAKRLALGGAGDALVMMVDDDPLLIELTQAFLTAAGYRRLLATPDAAGAVAMLLRELPDVLLLDLNAMVAGPVGTPRACH